MKTIRKIIAVLLTIATLIGIFSCGTSVFAEEYNEYAENKAYQENLLTETIEAEKEQAEIVCEVPEKRDEFSKTYKRADGSFTTVLSKSPLHKLQEGEWKDIDNSLKSEGEVIINTDGAFEIEFPEEISENEKITITNGDESISFSVNDVESAKSSIQTNETTEDLIQEDLNKTISQITYENIGGNTDIQYIVSSDSVKENIIVSKKESLKDEYTFEIEKGDLKAEIDKDNNITFKNNENETAFTIPAPVMTDADNGVSYDIDVELKNQDKSVITLIYTPSKEWLESEDRAYPVVIDPVIKFNSDGGDYIEDTGICYSTYNPGVENQTREDEVFTFVADIEETENGETTKIKSEVLVKVNMDVFAGLKQPNLAVTDVNFFAKGSAADGNLLVKTINGSWDAETITYMDVYPDDGTEPAITYSEDVIDYHTGVNTKAGEEAEGLVAFNITEAFNSWLSGEEVNNGFAIIAEEGATGMLYLDGYIETILDHKKTYYDTYIAVDYVDTANANDNYEYLTQEIGRAGSVSVNTFTRAASLYRSDLSMDGLRMPAQISFIQNSAFNSFIEIYFEILGATEAGLQIPKPYGNNWYPAYLQWLVEITEGQYQFFTEEGTLVTFNKKTETDNNITSIVFEEDEVSDSGYTLELIDQERSVDYDNFKITAPDGRELRFSDGGFVYEIREAEANADGTYDKILIAYDEEIPFMIDFVIDGIGRGYDFSYNSETGYLSEIKCLTADGTPIKAGTTNTDLKVSYGYDSNGNLISVTYPDGEAVTYTYDSNGNLIKAQNIDGYNIQYTYDSLGKVTNISEYAGTTPGNKIYLTQLGNRQVKVADDFSGTEIYQFGKDGKLHYTFDDRGNYLKSDYAPANDENVYSSNDWKISSQNLLKNGSFEEVTNGKAKDWTNSFNVEDVESSEALTDYACRVSAIEETTELQSQTVAVNGGKNYTFSLYAKSNLTLLTDNDRLYMRITAEDEDDNEKSVACQISPTESFEQYSITVSMETEISDITVEFGLKNKTGDFYVNNAQLEKGYGTAPFNYIKNGSFNNSDDNWTTATIVNETLNTEPVKAVKLNGGLPQYTVGYGLARTAEDGAEEELTLVDHISATTQNVKINGKKGDTYSIGGWFKGFYNDNSISSFVSSEYSPLVPSKTNSAAQIKVTYSYTDTVTTTDEATNETTTTEQVITENFVVDFAPHNNDWQYVADTFALKGDTESVDVTILAKNIPEDCFATGISFERDFESEFIEEDETETEDFDGEEEICSCGCEECYYGENCPCTGAINNDCQCPECLRKETSTQDNFGNTLSNKSTDSIHYIENLSSYTADGNNLATYTDENGNVITYDYDILNGILKSVTSPIGTENETTTTSYNYDAMGNVVSVSTTVSNTENQGLQYVYVKDKLTEIITPNGKYRIIYDVWGQVRSVNIVTVSNDIETVTPLVEYTYNTGANRTQVRTAVYKNSSTDRAEYTYEYYTDGTIKYVYLNGEQIHFVEYNNLGVLESIKNEGGRTVEYTDNGTFIYNPDDICIYSTKTNDDGSVTEENYGVTYTTFAPESDYDSATGISTETEKIEINSNSRITQETKSDYFGRTKSENLSVYNITGESEENPASLVGRINTEYGYSVEEDGKTSSSVEKFINKTYNEDSESYRVYDGYFYEYDKQNKISAEKTLNADGTTTDKYSYEYDKLGQLIRCNDAVENKTYTYTYDNNGNILTKSEYAYATGSLGTATDTTTYTYFEDWKDKLKKIDNQEIEYDNIGNPTTYLGATLAWEGRQLKSYKNDEYSITYEYDENGMRYRTTVVDKTKDEVTTANVDYVWLGEKLVSMVLSDAETYLAAKYLYDNSGEIIGFKWLNDTAAQSTYYFLKNLQGDITGVVSATGKMQVSYSYDVWGNRSTKYHANTSTPIGLMEYVNQVYISALNPFGYRGYCYDAYTDLYYLQSRYYDPNTGRFINADDTNYLNATGTVLGCNLFAYCENDAVNNVDPRGNDYVLITSRYSFIGRSLYIIDMEIDYISGKTTKRLGDISYQFYDSILRIPINSYSIVQIINNESLYYLSCGVFNFAKYINPDSLCGRTIEGVQFELLMHYILYIALRDKKNKTQEEEYDYKRARLVDIGACKKVNGKYIGYDNNAAKFESNKKFYALFKSKLFSKKYTAYALYKLARKFKVFE